MKKIFNFIAAAAALVLTVSACSDVFAPAESSTQPQVAGTVEIIISNVTDNSFDVTIAPKGQTAYYAYLVDNDEYYEGIDAASLYAVKYESIAQGNVKYGAGSESYSFTVETEPNTTYTVYAVAGSPEGNVGEVVYKTILTSDGVEPDVEDFQFQENMVAFVFGEEVVPVEGKKITATAYAKRYLTGSPVIASTEGKILSCADGVVIVQFPEIKVPGTFYIVSYEEGTFTDLVGNTCPGLPAGSFTAELKDTDKNDDAAVSAGTAWAYLENEDFEFDTEDVPEAILDYNTYVQFKSEQMLSKAFANKVSVSIVHSESGKTTTEEYALSGAPTYGATSYYSLGVKLPAEPARGDMITISIDKGAVMDIYGNVNEAFETDPMVYSYGYKLDDIIGDYNFTCETSLAIPLTLSIAAYTPNEDDEDYEDDVEAGYNVQFTSFSMWDCLLPVKGVFDFDLGTLFVPEAQIFSVVSGYYVALGAYSKPYDMTFNVTAPGVFSTPQTISLDAYTATSYAGSFGQFANFVATRVVADPAPGEGGASLINLTLKPGVRK